MVPRRPTSLLVQMATKEEIMPAKNSDDVNICSWMLSYWQYGSVEVVSCTSGKNSARKSGMLVTPPVTPMSYCVAVLDDEAHQSVYSKW